MRNQTAVNWGLCEDEGDQADKKERTTTCSVAKRAGFIEQH